MILNGLGISLVSFSVASEILNAMKLNRNISEIDLEICTKNGIL